MRRVFQQCGLGERWKAGGLRMLMYPPTARVTQRPPFEAVYNQEFILSDPLTGLVAKCHWFLGEDMVTPIPGAMPDPKEISLPGGHFRLVSRSTTKCKHCIEALPFIW